MRFQDARTMGLLAKSHCQQLIVKAYRLFWLRLCRAMKEDVKKKSFSPPLRKMRVC